MSQTAFDYFITLVKLDTYLYDLSQRHFKTQENLHFIDQNVCALNSQVKQAETQLQELKKNIHYQELELKTLDLRAQETQSKLDKVSSPKEFLSLQSELDKLLVQRDKQEDELIFIWQSLEQTEQKQALFLQDAQAQLQKLELDYKALEKALKELMQEQQRYELERPELLELFPEDWLADYISMQERVINPVVFVKNQSCSACFYVITAQDLAALKNRKLLRCKQCYRFLYIEID